ncbi:hypothetical protein ACQQ2Q_08915 [Agrobacterium sp. ES01]|uniref:hypothetical protein n=1 Tax=Agrobacterium sp. ES01 TaxID=3420714 RepID=UPI003D1387BF
MNNPNYYYPLGIWVLAVGAALGLAVALYNFVVPLTGVNGSIGAGLVVFSTAIMLLAALFFPIFGHGALRNVVRALIVLDIVCTAAAGYFLHEWLLIGAMVVALIGAIWEIAQPSPAATTFQGAA